MNDAFCMHNFFAQLFSFGSVSNALVYHQKNPENRMHHSLLKIIYQH